VTPIHQDIKVATGNAIAVLCKCVKQESSDAGTQKVRIAVEAVEDFSSGVSSPAEVVQVSTTDWDRKRHRCNSWHSQRVRARRQRPDPGAPDKSEA